MITILLSLVGIFFIYVMFSMNSFSDMCENDIKQIVKSPDNKMKAIIFSRDCGATTGFNRQISLLKHNENLEDIPGNVLRLDGEPNLIVEWKNSNELIVSHPLDPSFKASEEINNIKIWYMNK